MTDAIALFVGFAGIILATVVFVHSRKMDRKLRESMSNYQVSNDSVGRLIEEFKKFKVAFDFAYDAILIADGDGVVLYSNDSFSRVTGFTSAEIIGHKAGTLWGGLMPEDFYRQLWQTIKVDRVPFFGTMKNKRKNGQIYHAAVSIAPILNPEETEVQYFIAVERDLDEKLPRS